jgi:transcriptional regulator with XRE-family HTH domain
MRTAREHSGLNQIEAAALIGIKQGTLSELEKSATKSGHTARAAAVYKVSAGWLQDGSGKMIPQKADLSPRAAFVAQQLDAIADPAAFDQACVICEAFVALAKAGQLGAVAASLKLATPATAPTPKPPIGHRSHAGAAPQKRT